MEIPIKVRELLDKKAAEDNTIDLNAYALGLTDMYHLLKSSTPSIRIGSKLKVTNNLSGHQFDIGDIVTVIRYYPESNYYDCVGSKNYQDWSLMEDEFELVTE